MAKLLDQWDRLFAQFLAEHKLSLPLAPTNTQHNVEVIIDEREPSRARMVQLLKEMGVRSSTRTLPTGDYMWIQRVGAQVPLYI